MKNDRFHSILGISKKAGKLVSGTYSVDKYLKLKKVFLVILARDVSKNTYKKFSRMCEFRNIPYIVHSTKELLARAIGREQVGVIGITDEGLAKVLLDAAKEENYGGE
ncbi:ribosomal protein L7Ae/L30e/S12e/gadd45 [Thermoanaerobacter kivui]|uniref:Ribosomal protein L7Ae/L30e/S12e/gadd45 n=1 Tax=Thermoanaerobacter kivui TaxID=2325 RepID=A0A097ARQ3_THEKI|nr:ribosomal L7Ae/L30e/S12e/Gadd45 family protein [Thermoanaerobacter kivui]AIS52482.1 ribosomal protein L7Ae/L30e/S12e/gadd45 [Thermoanaerobacter kivui]